MKLSMNIFLATFTALSIAACGGMEQGDFDQGDELASSEDAVTGVDDCAQNFEANATFEQSKMALATGDSYTRTPVNLTCPGGVRNMTIVKSNPLYNHCYVFYTTSDGDTLTEQANESFGNCVSTKFWGQLNYWDGSDYQVYDEVTIFGKIVFDGSADGWHCDLPNGTAFKFYNGAPLSTSKLKLRGTTTRADGEGAKIKMWGYDNPDLETCLIIGG